MSDNYLTAEELNGRLKGATILGFRALLNGRDVVLETTAGSVLMTNEMSYKLIAPVDANPETQKPIRSTEAVNDATYSC